MDKKIKKKTWTVKRITTYAGIALFIVFVGYQFIFADRRSKLKVDSEKKDLVKSVASIITKRQSAVAKRKAKATAKDLDVVVAGDNNTINLFGKSRRQVLEGIKTSQKIIDAETVSEPGADK